MSTPISDFLVFLGEHGRDHEQYGRDMSAEAVDRARTAFRHVSQELRNFRKECRADGPLNAVARNLCELNGSLMLKDIIHDSKYRENVVGPQIRVQPVSRVDVRAAGILMISPTAAHKNSERIEDLSATLFRNPHDGIEVLIGDDGSCLYGGRDTSSMTLIHLFQSGQRFFFGPNASAAPDEDRSDPQSDPDSDSVHSGSDDSSTGSDNEPDDDQTPAPDLDSDADPETDNDSTTDSDSDRITRIFLEPDDDLFTPGKIVILLDAVNSNSVPALVVIHGNRRSVLEEVVRISRRAGRKVTKLSTWNRKLEAGGTSFDRAREIVAHFPNPSDSSEKASLITVDARNGLDPDFVRSLNTLFSKVGDSRLGMVILTDDELVKDVRIS